MIARAMRTGGPWALLALLAAARVAGAQGTAPPPTTTPAAPNDYSKPATWLCRPGRTDACTVDLSTTIVASDGTLKDEDFHADPDPPVDCFYLYPTVSLDETPNSDMNPGPEERGVVAKQFARFAAVCRLYAPLYRQTTLPELNRALRGQSNGGDDRIVYGDVLDSWHYYLEHDNHGRGVVLIGHSQGGGLLTRVLQQEVDAKPRQAPIGNLVDIVRAQGKAWKAAQVKRP